MMTVNEVSKLTGVSIRTLQYYDTIGLLKPIEYTESGYRLYDDTSLERLQQILLFKELEFPLKEIKKIIDAPNFDRNKALEQQIELLTMKKEHLENLINFAQGIKQIGVKYMNFKVFDTKKIDEYCERAKEQWVDTAEYKEYEEKTKNWTKEDEVIAENEFMEIFAEFGQMKKNNSPDEQVQAQVKKLQDYITEHFEGNCLIAAGDEDLIKIHFHTNEPWKVLEYCSTIGEIYDIVVEDMIRQSAGLHG